MCILIPFFFMKGFNWPHTFSQNKPLSLQKVQCTLKRNSKDAIWETKLKIFHMEMPFGLSLLLILVIYFYSYIFIFLITSIT